MTASPKFPQALAALPQWVCWRLEPDKRSGRDAKVPYNPHTGNRASASNPATWGTLAQALDCAKKYHFTGVGFMFTEDSEVKGIDIDNCLDEKLNPNAVAKAILKKCPPTYIEISPSVRGLHIFLRGRLPPGGNKNSETGVEMYAKARYFTMTGNRWPSCADEIAVDNGALSWIHSQYILKKTQPKKKKAQGPAGISSLTDDELLTAARGSRDGPAFEALWQGDWQGKYPSQSEADFALCCKLAFWSNRDADQIDRLFRGSGLMREKWGRAQGGSTYGEISVRNACAETKQTYTPKRKKTVNIFEQDGCYYRKKGENIIQLTNFLIQPGDQIKGEKEAQLVCDLISDSGKTQHMTFAAEDFCNLQRFKRVLNKTSISFCFFATEGDLEALKQYIDGLQWKLKKGVKALGIYLHMDRFVFVTSDRAVAAGGAEVDTIVQMEHHRALDCDILDAPYLTNDQMIFLGERILNYNAFAKTVPILAWCAGCFIKPHLKKGKIKFPHLFLIGEMASGKSYTLEHVVLPIFSRSKVQAASQVTNFTLPKSGDSTNVVPHAIDEFKPSTLEKKRIGWLHSYFRDSYDGHEGIRGQADQSQRVYDLLAPVVVCGEESPDEAAIRERTIELLFSKKDVKDPVQKKIIDGFRDDESKLRAFGRTLLDVALQTMPTEAQRWHAEGLGHFNDDFPPRIANNLACAFAGLNLVQKLCHAFDHGWDYYFPLPLEACAGHLSYAARAYLLDGGNHNSSILEQTFEVMARMNLKPEDEFTFAASGRHLCLWMTHVYDRFTRYVKDYAIRMEVLTYPQFRKQLEHSDYFVEKNWPVAFGKNRRKAWIIDFEKLSQVVDLGGFLSVTLEDE